jgi:hypothetical protein
MRRKRLSGADRVRARELAEGTSTDAVAPPRPNYYSETKWCVKQVCSADMSLPFGAVRIQNSIFRHFRCRIILRLTPRHSPVRSRIRPTLPLVDGRHKSMPLGVTTGDLSL